MRRFATLLTALLAAASNAAALPQGTDHFRLAMTRTEFDSLAAERRMQVVSDSPNHVACLGTAPVEFERYDFASPARDTGLLWRAATIFRMPCTRAEYDSVRAALTVTLGEPAQVVEPDPTQIGAIHRVTWVDRQTTVELAARWPERPDPQADRMIVTWIDRRLLKAVAAETRAPSKKTR